MSDKSLVFDATKPASADKPDHSDTFFSARRPASTVFGMEAHSSAFGKSMDHPWRYFVAGGESLAKIEQVIAESKTVDDGLKALAAEVGAEDVNNGYFIFKNADVEAVAPQVRLQYTRNEIFICNAASPGDFFPNPRYREGMAVKRDIIAIQDLAAEEAEAARAALAKKYKAESFDGKFFHFHGWEELVESAQIQREKKFRLKSNPAFVRGAHDGDAFSVDQETDEGFRIAAKMSEITSRRYPEQRFAQWISSFALDLSLRGNGEGGDRKSAEVEKIDGEWIVKVTVVFAGIFGVDGKGGVRTGEKEGWVMPPGAKAIAVSEYYAKLEKSGTLRALPTIAPTSV